MLVWPCLEILIVNRRVLLCFDIAIESDFENFLDNSVTDQDLKRWESFVACFALFVPCLVLDLKLFGAILQRIHPYKGVHESEPPCLHHFRCYKRSEHQLSGTKKVPQRNYVTKIVPNFWVNFLVRFASNPLFY